RVSADEPEAAAALVESGFRSVIVDPPFHRYSPEEIAQTSTLLNTLKEQDVYRILTLEPVAEEQETQLRQALSSLVESASFDAILVADSAAGDGLASFTHCLNDLLSKAGLALPVLFEAAGAPEQEDAPLPQLLKELIADTPQAELLVKSDSSAKSQLEAWKELMDSDMPITLLLDIKNAMGGGTLEDALRFFKELELCDETPLAFSSADYIPGSDKAATLLRQFFADNLDLSAITKPISFRRPVKELKSEQTINTAEPEITFSGGSSPLYSLFCNDKEITRNDSGDFTLERQLQAGKNTFTFTHQDKSYVFHVIYQVKVLDTVSPSSLLETTGGIDLVVKAAARRGATVKAALGSQTVQLKPGSAKESEEGNKQQDANFITYEGVFQLQQSDTAEKTLGSVKVTASYQGITDTKTGAKIVLLAKEPDPPPPPPTTTAKPDTAGSTETETGAGTSTGTSTGTTGTGTGTSAVTGTSTSTGTGTSSTAKAASTAAPQQKTLLSPYKSNGVPGTSRMVEITADYANSRLNSVLDDKSVPRSSPLLKGSFDYIVGSDVSGGLKYYHLKSGKRVNGEDLKVIEGGYNLPLNTLQATSRVTDGALEMRFAVDWKIPFNVDLLGQSYVSNNGYPHGVNSFTGNGLEIVFYHSSGHSGKVDVSGFSLLKSAEFSRNASANTVTLKLSFAQAGRYYGYKAYYDGSQLVIRLNPKPAKSLSGVRIMLDAGHGGSEVGSDLYASHATLKYEKQVNLLLAQKVKAKLEAKGATVLMTRSSDVFVTLKERVAMLRTQNPDMYISIHCDSFNKSSVMGTSAFYYRANAMPLADAIHKRIVSVYKDSIYTNANYGSEAAALRGGTDRGTRFYPFAVTRVEECPSVLIEYGFGSNLTECRVLQKDQYQELFAQATVDGIVDYLTAQY
ncbi:MAG: N-acetylmuramoyl-L-alanine amidase, partial [Oscillospiraceae bacterium]|nr:N-acetylmuramoyl-L-alanine amidase [Oscillospiraceae bacterium]